MLKINELLTKLRTKVYLFIWLGVATICLLMIEEILRQQRKLLGGIYDCRPSYVWWERGWYITWSMTSPWPSVAAGQWRPVAYRFASENKNNAFSIYRYATCRRTTRRAEWRPLTMFTVSESEWVRVGLFNRRIRAIVTMRRGVY